MKQQINADNLHFFVKLSTLPVNSVTKFEYDTFEDSYETLYLHKDEYGTRIIKQDDISKLSDDVTHINPHNYACFIPLLLNVSNEYDKKTNSWAYIVNELSVRKKYYIYLNTSNNTTHSIELIRAGDNGFISFNGISTQLIKGINKRFHDIKDIKYFMTETRMSVEQEFIEIVHAMHSLENYKMASI